MTSDENADTDRSDKHDACLKLPAVATLLQVTPRAVQRWVSTGRVQAHRHGLSRFISPAEFEALTHRTPPADD